MKPFEQFVFTDAFGSDFMQEMLVAFESRSIAVQFLKDVDSRKRIAALEVLLKHWNPLPSVIQSACLELVNDVDIGVRAAAIGFWGDALAASNDVYSSKFLARVALDESKSTRERRAAYRSIEQIQGLPQTSVSKSFDSEMSERKRELDETLNDSLPDMNTDLLHRLAELHE